MGDLIEEKKEILKIDDEIKENMRDKKKRVIDQMKKSEESVISMRLGIGMKNENKMEEVGKKLQVKSESIRKIEEKEMRKMKNKRS